MFKFLLKIYNRGKTRKHILAFEYSPILVANPEDFFKLILHIFCLDDNQARQLTHFPFVAHELIKVVIGGKYINLNEITKI